MTLNFKALYATRTISKQLGIAAIAALSLAVPYGARAENSRQTPAEAVQFNAVAAWDEFEHLLREKYAYIERDDMDVEAQLERSKALALQTHDRAGFRRILHQTALTFSDPHLIVGPFDDDDFNIVMTSSDLAMQVEDGRAIIADVRRDSAAFKAGLRPGDEVLEVDGVPALEAAMVPYGAVLPDPAPRQIKYGLTLAVNGQRAGNRSITVIDADTGQIRTITLENARKFARAINDRDPVSLSFAGPEGEVAVLQVNNSLGNNETIAAFDTKLTRAIESGATAVALDMRETPSGGNTEVARSIIGHFIAETRPYQMHRIPAFEREFTVPRQFVEYVVPRAPHFAGPVFVLHGKWTGSMGEGIVMGMDAATDAVTIGSDMGDLLGALWNYDLKHSGARLDLGGEALFHVDGTPREDYVAQRPILPASTARDGSDPALAEALRLLESL